MAGFDTGYKERSLTFESDKIKYSKDGKEFNVMMDWETPIMRRSAEWVTNGGKVESVLELGFGMGISAGFIQNYQPVQHTIIETHLAITERANAWAGERNTYYDKNRLKNRVTILGGKNWFDEFRKSFEKSGLQEFDAIFIDTYQDTKLHEFKNYITKMLKKGGRMTWWNPMENFIPDETTKNRRGVSYELIRLSDYKIQIPKNEYHNTNEYYMPMYIRQ